MSRLAAVAGGYRRGRRRYCAAAAERLLARLGTKGIEPNDILQLARATIASIARGWGATRQVQRLAAAEFVLSPAFLPHLTDEQLLFEIKRRNAAHKANNRVRP